MKNEPLNARSVRVVALTVGPHGSAALWTLRRLVEAGFEVVVVRGIIGSEIAPSRRLRRLVRDHGILHVASRVSTERVVGRWYARRAARIEDGLFGARELQAWWNTAGLREIEVPHLNAPAAREAIRALAPDVMVRVSGGMIRKGTFTLAKWGTINIHHGMAPAIRGMWSIPWAIVEHRPSWIGATVHQIDDGIDTGPVYSRVAPQLSAGATAEELFFRSHLLAVAALVDVIRILAAGGSPPELEWSGESVYRTAPGWVPYLRFLAAGAGAFRRWDSP